MGIQQVHSPLCLVLLVISRGQNKPVLWLSSSTPGWVWDFAPAPARVWLYLDTG